MSKKGSKTIEEKAPEIVVTPHGNYINFTGEESLFPTLEYFRQAEIDKDRVKAVGRMLDLQAPVDPKNPSMSAPSVALGLFGVADDTRNYLFGPDKNRRTCLYTVSSQYNDTPVASNKMFSENPEAYGFKEVGRNEAGVGDVVQFWKEGTIPSHATMMTGYSPEGIPLITYSNGNVPAYKEWHGPNGEYSTKDNLIRNREITDKPVQDLGTEHYYRYIGSPKKNALIDRRYQMLINGQKIYKEGGFLQPKDAWDKLSMREKAEMMKVAVDNGIYNLKEIRQKYNEFAEGGDTEKPYTVGNIVDALYGSNQREEYLGEPSHHYDFTQSEEWANTHGYYPDARGHRDDRVKKASHPSHPSRGTWNGDKFELTDLGMQNPNYTLFGLTDGGQDPQAVLTYQGGIVLPEVTVTPNENYFFNPYDNIILHQKANGGRIHIKPENRGKFTALKKRTGHSASWFKAHGTPAQKKMATFALNARHWKHGDGGPLVNLFYPGGTITYGAPHYLYDENGKIVMDGGKPVINYNSMLSDITIIPDSQKSSADRNEDERYRQRTQDDYANQKDRDYTQKQVTAVQKDWETSTEKKVLDYAQAAATGIGIGTDIVSGLPIYSSLKGVSILNEAKTPIDYVEGGLWLSPLVGGIYQIAKPIVKQAAKEAAIAWDLKNPQVPEGFSDITPKIEKSNTKSVFVGRPVTIAETVKAGERGRNRLIDRFSSDWYAHRWEEAAPSENTNIVINGIINDVKDAPVDYSLSKYQLNPSGLTYGKTYAIQSNPDKITLPDGTIVSDYNTGLGIKVAADIGEDAENTAMHELIHYSTGNSYGLTSGTVKPTMGGLLDPVGYKYDLLNPKQIIIPRGKRYQHFMVDYNESLLPKEDPNSIYNLIINNPSEAERKLVDTGLTVKEAKKKIQEMLPDAEYYTDKQEQQTFLKTWFFDKIVPKLKDPNNASEIEKYLLEHPEMIQKDYYVNTLMNTIRPGSIKQYAKALSKMLSTIYAIGETKDLITE